MHENENPKKGGALGYHKRALEEEIKTKQPRRRLPLICMHELVERLLIGGY